MYALAAFVVWFFTDAPTLLHLSNVSKPLWFSEFEAPSRATEFTVPPLLAVTVISLAVTLPLAAPFAVLVPREAVIFFSDRANAVSIACTDARSFASFRALARVLAAFMAFCSSAVFFLKSSVSVSVVVTAASVPLSAIATILFISSAFQATPAPKARLVLELPSARPPTILLTVVLLSAARVTALAAFTTDSSSTSTRLLLPPARIFKEPDTPVWLSALPALRITPVWIMELLV